MKQGCLLVSGEFLAEPDIFDMLIDEFNLIRQIEVEDGCHILVVEHEQFLETALGEFIPFYEPVFGRGENGIAIKEIGSFYFHSKYLIKCQNKEESKSSTKQEEELFPGLM